MHNYRFFLLCIPLIFFLKNCFLFGFRLHFPFARCIILARDCISKFRKEVTTMESKRNLYENARLEVVSFDDLDIITTSIVSDPNKDSFDYVDDREDSWD